MVIDGIDFLNFTAKPRFPNTSCINRDFAVVGWSRERGGLFDIGQGKDLESAIAIARLHSGHDDYIHFPDGVTVGIHMSSKEPRE
jgi:hypothetical protein